MPQLAFDSRSQRLGTVTVTDPTALTITYEHALLSTSARRPTFLEVYEVRAYILIAVSVW